MSDLPKVFIGVLIGILIIGGAIMLFSHPNSDTTNVTEQNVSDGGSISDVIQEKVQTLTNQQNVANNTVQNAQNYNSNNTNTYSNSNSNSNSNNGNSGSGQQNQYQVSGGHSEKNYQAGQGEFYEISYSDGNFRQYDTKTGELVGSSFDEDQEKLGVVDGDLV